MINMLDVNTQSSSTHPVDFTIAQTATKVKKNNGVVRLRMVLLLVVMDLVALFGSCSAALVLWSFRREDLILSYYTELIPLVFIFVFVYALTGLYSTSGVNPVEELRLLTITTTVTFLGLGALSFWFRNAEMISRASFVLGWFFSLITIPVGRQLLRSVAAKWEWWGEPVAIIGYGNSGKGFTDFLQAHPRLGYHPVVLINGFIRPEEKTEDHPQDYPLPFLDATGFEKVKENQQLKDIRTAVILQQDVPVAFLNTLIQEYGFKFSNLILIPDIQPFSSLWVLPLNIGGVLGLRIHQNLKSKWQQGLKRALDLTLIGLLSPVFLLLVSAIALIIRVDSPGGAFFTQERIGRGGRKIRVWKFRTMVDNAEEILGQHLTNNSEISKEWMHNQKIKADPRITRVGKFLRKLSLDELPQVWNVLKGEMSLVGPRPIVEEEIRHYAEKFTVYKQVRPGITGFWQVSGRNDVDYATRVRLDEYYIRNWSVWFDLYIIAKTPWSVISGNGAY